MAEEAVPYQALYRRFRPQRFADVLGQDHVTRALRAAVRDGKVAHAYLFSGPRGTGKTSTARILAMALNCENPADGEPCGVCQSCVAVRSGASLDVQELDSATNRGIDEMRDLLSRVSLGTPGRWKVYIVDEVHQITAAAASALLKTLEEPPAHVIFVLATTDPQKVLETIRSRTQHFEFRLLGSEVLAALLEDVAGRADIDLAPGALEVVVRRGHGSARDALSALDQVAAAGIFEDDSTVVADLVGAVAARDAGQVLVQVAQAVQAGRDARRLGTELLEYLRNGFLATRARSLVMLSEQAAAEVEAQARELGPAALVRAMDLVGQALIDMRDSADPRTTLEVALVRLAAPEVDDSRAALLERVERLEKAVAEGSDPAGLATGRPTSGPVAARPAAAGPAVTPGPGSGPARPAASGPAPPRPASPGGLGPPPPAPGSPAPGRRSETAPDLGRLPEASAPPAGRDDEPVPAAVGGPPSVRPAGRPARPEPSAGDPAPSREELTVAWGDRILPSLRPAVKVYVATGRFLPSEGDTAIYAVPDKGLLTRAEPNRTEVEAAISQHFARPVRVRMVLDTGTSAPPASEPVHDEPASHEWAEMEEASAAVVSPEQRLLDAFPGAEEIQQ